MKKYLFLWIAWLSSAWLWAAVNINTASQTELQTLPHIGPAKAEAIVKYRIEHGPFQRVEDIQKVKGIGPSTFEKLRPEITTTEAVSYTKPSGARPATR